MTQMSNDSYGDGNTYRGQRSRDSVVKTITLAQPEQIPPSAYSNTHQPEREPVQTTPNFAQLKQILDNLDRCHHRDSKQEFLRTWIRDWTEHKLTKHTTPPQPEPEPCDMGKMCIGCSPRNADGSCPDAQRKPLTDEQIAHATAPVFMGGEPSLTGIARAIEAAHGIKE